MPTITQNNGESFNRNVMALSGIPTSPKLISSQKIPQMMKMVPQKILLGDIGWFFSFMEVPLL